MEAASCTQFYLCLRNTHTGDTKTEGIMSKPDLIKLYLQTDGVIDRIDQTHLMPLH